MLDAIRPFRASGDAAAPQTEAYISFQTPNLFSSECHKPVLAR